MNDIVTENLVALQESKSFNKLGDIMKEHLTETFGSQVNMTREVKMYGSILCIADFAKISEKIFFMSSKEIYRHYVTQSQKYKLLALQDGVDHALKEANQTAREETFRSKYPELIDDKRLTMRRVTTSFDKIDLISKDLFSMLGGSVKINSHLGLMILDIVEEDGSHQIETISNYSRKSFAFFISHMLMSVINFDEAEKIAAKVEEFLSLYGKLGTVIQFNDCYVREGIACKGFYEDEDLPRFFIDRAVYPAVESMKPTLHVQAVDDLLMNLCNFDQSIYNRIISVMSTVFLNSEYLKTKFNSSIRFVGKDGRNGKSLFSALMQRAFGKANCHIFSIADLADSKTLYAVVNSLVAIDSDSTGKTISDDASALFKSITSGESIEVKGLYREAEKIQSCCSIIAFSNMMPNSSDKTTAYLRRLEITRCDYQILNEYDKVGPNSKRSLIETDEQFFEDLRSEEAAQYLMELLLIESQKLMKTGRYPARPESMEHVLQIFAEENDSASAFVHEVGLSEIVGYSISEVRQKYHDWCEENDMTELKRKFNETLEDRFALSSKLSTSINTTNPASNAYMLLVSGSKKSVRCWQMSTVEKTKKFLEKIANEGHSEDES